MKRRAHFRSGILAREAVAEAVGEWSRRSGAELERWVMVWEEGREDA